MSTTPPSATATDRTDQFDGMAYALSHDVRARLRAASGFLELARVELDDGTDIAHFLDRAASAARLADRMIERMVRYLRISPIADLVATDPRDIIREAAVCCADGPELIVDPLPDAMADHDLLVSAVTEILDNAARYRAADRSPTVRVTGTVEGPHTVLRFADNGFGISADRVDRAFEIFRQVHRVGDNPGSGMGLPVARRCIEYQGGTMTLSPGPAGGAVVEIRLLAPPDVRPRGEHSP